jgi:ABC-type multidrug transport system ATPase subunit
MEEVEEFCDRVIIMKDGRILEQGSPTGLKMANVPDYTVKVKPD